MFISKNKKQNLIDTISCLQHENHQLHEDCMKFMHLYNDYHKYFIEKEHVYFPLPIEEDAFAKGCGKAMQCSKCGRIVGSEDNYCRKCGARLKYV